MCPFCLSGGMVLIGGVVSAGGLGVWIAKWIGAPKKEETEKRAEPEPARDISEKT